MTSPNPSDAELRRLLERTRPVAGYDVEAGLERHRKLLEQGAPPPDWIRSVVRARRMSSAWLLSALGGVALLGGILWQHEQGALVVAAQVVAPEVMRPASAEGLRPSVEPLVVVAPADSREPSQRVASAGASASPPTLEALEPAREVVPAVAPRAAAPVGATNVEAQGSTRKQAVPGANATARPAWRPGPSSAARLATPAPVVTMSAEPAPNAQEAPDPEPVAALAEPARQPAPEAIDPQVLEEMQQLASAERLLPTMPSRTLSMVREGMQRFPHGLLAQERRYLEIMALVALRMPKDAELLSRNFFRDYPKGPYRRKVERALEDGSRR
jgi:hypothetical protein